MDRVDILICHGGNGTVYQALSHGVPLLFFPGNFEQEWNIQRIIEMGLGARLEDGFDASKVRNIIDSWAGKRKGDLFCEVQQSIESFANKPVVLTHVPKD
jgi:UDP-N-acetylglucosamine:LPS N-acetylglucosamine transferase